MEDKSFVQIPMNTSVKMDMDAYGKAVDQTRYRALIRSLLYLTATRPDITFAVGVCARFQYSDYAGCRADRKSTSGICQMLGNRLVSWFSKKQNCVSLSTAKAEYISVAFCCTQLLWMKQTLADYKCSFENIPIFCDNSL
ncbi:hypothetical protein DH2020_002302 [Rehmannia glutinosa]|uniref:Uncharacterized protein n=1 Tax=Rehmannia glutinosa TaxID=99300 RepID=A0ABR0XTH5_REHGL